MVSDHFALGARLELHCFALVLVNEKMPVKAPYNRVVDFLLVLIELFPLGVTAEAQRFKIGDFAPTGAG